MTILSAVANLLHGLSGNPRDAVAKVIRANKDHQRQIEETISFLGAGHLLVINRALPKTASIQSLIAKYDLDLPSLTGADALSKARAELVDALYYLTPEWRAIDAEDPLSILLQARYTAFNLLLRKKLTLLGADLLKQKLATKTELEQIQRELDAHFITISHLYKLLYAYEQHQQQRA